MNIFRAVCAVALCSALSAEAADSVMAVRRTNAENYKDRAIGRSSGLQNTICAAITAIPWKVTPGQNLLC